MIVKKSTLVGIYQIQLFFYKYILQFEKWGKTYFYKYFSNRPERGRYLTKILNIYIPIYTFSFPPILWQGILFCLCHGFISESKIPNRKFLSNKPSTTLAPATSSAMCSDITNHDARVCACAPLLHTSAEVRQCEAANNVCVELGGCTPVRCACLPTYRTEFHWNTWIRTFLCSILRGVGRAKNVYTELMIVCRDSTDDSMYRLNWW